jgi:hypothetical protein
MAQTVGSRVVNVLERSGQRYLGTTSSLFQVFALQIGGSTTLLEYEQTPVYWQRVQILIDAFFTAQQRLRIYRSIMARIDLASLPEARGFLADALAERRLGGMLDALDLLPFNTARR